MEEREEKSGRFKKNQDLFFCFTRDLDKSLTRLIREIYLRPYEIWISFNSGWDRAVL